MIIWFWAGTRFRQKKHMPRVQRWWWGYIPLVSVYFKFQPFYNSSSQKLMDQVSAKGVA